MQRGTLGYAAPPASLLFTRSGTKAGGKASSKNLTERMQRNLSKSAANRTGHDSERINKLAFITVWMTAYKKKTSRGFISLLGLLLDLAFVVKHNRSTYISVAAIKVSGYTNLPG